MATAVTEVGHSCGQDEPVGTSININGDKFMEIIFISTDMVFSENNDISEGNIVLQKHAAGALPFGEKCVILQSLAVPHSLEAPRKGR